MPRGVAIHDLQHQLFVATGRLLGREGPAALSSRRITAEAGVAKGVLHNHFTDLDDFLAQFVMHTFHTAHRLAEELTAKAGEATVAENLTQTAHVLLESQVAAAHSILLARPSLTMRLGHSHGHRPGLESIEQSVTHYLDAEKELGRITPDADTEAIAIALVATIHRLLLGERSVAQLATVTRVIDVLTTTTDPRRRPE